MNEAIGLILGMVFIITLLGLRAESGEPVNFLFMGDYVCKPYVEKGRGNE